MKTNKFATVLLIAVIMLVQAGNAFGTIILGDRSDDGDGAVCTETKDTTKVDNGVIVTLTGVIVTLTGVIVTFADDKTDNNENCGIIMSD